MMRVSNPFLDADVIPIERPDGDEYAALVSRVRAELTAVGCAVVRNILTPEGITALVAEADAVAPHAHRSSTRTNAYFSQDDEALRTGHPVRRFYDRSNAFVPADNFVVGGPLRSIYDTPGFDEFIRDCLQADSFHRYADPLADVIVNSAGDGPGFPWHFDTNDYTVTLAIQVAE